ncbi:hypothetical protein B0H17DRAFT_1046778 [Mycena rosella]|uniref:DUF6534 domain-containing protein n=1 Tax=Mycena rosella TaxID=1033263 RepID=A0AAD7DVP4_MYCRO|nr:hypothetical protein B0H17DRAFT_1046778 [Mycena rosella]
MVTSLPSFRFSIMPSPTAKLTVPMFIGTLLNWALFGVLLVQIYLYFLAFPKDRLSVKLLIGFILVAEILQTLGDTRNAIRIFGSEWGNLDALDDVGWAWFSVPVMGSTVSAVGQLFYAWRIYVIGRNPFIPVLVSLVAVVQLGGGLWTGSEIMRAQRFSLLQEDNVRATGLWLSASALCDLIIVCGTVFYLLKFRRTGLRSSTNAVVVRIIKISVETGLFCAIFAIVDLYLFVTYKGTNYHLAICTALSKMYSNSIIVILNSRAHIRSTTPDEASRNVSDLIFKSEMGMVSALEAKSIEASETHSSDDTHTDKFPVVERC